MARLLDCRGDSGVDRVVFRRGGIFLRQIRNKGLKNYFMPPGCRLFRIKLQFYEFVPK